MGVTGHTESEASLTRSFRLPAAIYGPDMVGMTREHYDGLVKAARDMAVLALQGNDYHRGNKDFRDAVDDVLAITDPRAHRSDEEKSS